MWKMHNVNSSLFKLAKLDITGTLTSELLPVDAVLVLRHLVLLPRLPCPQLLALASPRLVQDDLIA